MTFSPRNCQSRHSILYVNWVRACRTNFHGCWSRDDQTRPLFERTNCQFLKIITFCPKSESHKNYLFSPKLSIATFHLVRELGPGLPDKFAWLRVTRRPNSTPVWTYELSISQNNDFSCLNREKRSFWTNIFLSLIFLNLNLSSSRI